jgi:hypothetical protein
MANPRTYTNFATPKVKKHLNTLIADQIPIKEYQDAMFALGQELGSNLQIAQNQDEQFLVVSTSEDADYLTSGFIDSLEERGINYKIAVFWNHHYSLKNGDSVAPIINSYIQEDVASCTKIVLLKSIISGSCVIRTNLLALLDSLNLEVIESISVAAPVMHVQSQEKLRKEFPGKICQKFEFLTFAIDSKKDEHGNVLDGIGGEVYPHLGFETQPALLQTGYMPKLVSNLLFSK